MIWTILKNTHRFERQSVKLVIDADTDSDDF